MVTENIQLEGVGQRLSHSLIQKVRIDHDDVFNTWHVNIKCSIPATISEEEKAELKTRLKQKTCHGECHYIIDREGMDKVIALLQSNSIHRYETKIKLLCIYPPSERLREMKNEGKA